MPLSDGRRAAHGGMAGGVKLTRGVMSSGPRSKDVARSERRAGWKGRREKPLSWRPFENREAQIEPQPRCGIRRAQTRIDTAPANTFVTPSVQTGPLFMLMHYVEIHALAFFGFARSPAFPASKSGAVSIRRGGKPI